VLEGELATWPKPLGGWLPHIHIAAAFLTGETIMQKGEAASWVGVVLDGELEARDEVVVVVL
tara:strand:+ start:254 stop:439 length:186 start_codon:yes stop_codon:yes gene_type:complete